MDSPLVALRFRDTTHGFDTIKEHKALIASEGAVWWGWWRKNTEPKQSVFLNELASRGQGQAVLLDRSTQRMFHAEFLRVVTGGSAEIDPLRIPEYYQHKADNIAAWFLFTSIESVEYEDVFGKRIGEKTILILRSEDGESLEAPAESISAGDRNHILHLSDLHFGNDYAFLRTGSTPDIGDPRRTLTSCLTADLERLGIGEDIAAVLVTGDFTTQGDWGDSTRMQILNEFAELRLALGLREEQIIALPGNHDVVRYPPGTELDVARIAVAQQTRYKHEDDFRLFVDELSGRGWREPLNYCRSVRLKDADLFLCILNSCTITATEWTEYGFVGDAGLDALDELSKIPVERPTYKIIAIHHHLVPASNVEAPNSRGVSLTLDSVALLDAAQKAGAQVAVHGHQHQPRITRYSTMPFLGRRPGKELVIVAAGSAGAIGNRRPGDERNSYGVFRWDSSGVHLTLRELRTDGREAGTLFDGSLSVDPEIPPGS